MTIHALLRRALPALCLVAAAYAEPPSAFHQVKAWEGRVKVAGSASGSISTIAGDEKWSMSYDTDLRLVLDQYIPIIRMWHGRLIGTGNVKGSYSNSMPYCTRTESITASGAPAGDPKVLPVSLQVGYDGTYRLDMNWLNVPGTFHTRLACTAGNTERTEPTDYDWWVWDFPGQFPLPSSGLKIQGQGIYSADLAFDTQGYALLGQKEADVPVKIEWELWPAGTRPDVELIISADGYDEWRPRAAKGGGRGNKIALRAQLRSADGSAADEKAMKFEWSFGQVSREPGYAMNYPVQDADVKPDLRFEEGEGVTIRDEGLQASSAVGLWSESRVTVGSYDWGGFGDVRVVATLLDGRRIEGKLQGAPAPGMLLPKRAAGDLIAEIWRKERGVMGVADSSDREDEPVGDGNRGDGLTLYQEYRGFIEAGDHIEGDPRKKDYFVTNLAGGAYMPGILMFQHLTGLAVHYQFTASEWPEDRTINANHAATPHAVDQHGVVIFFKDASSGYAEAAGGPGNPKMIRGVFVPAMSGGTKAKFARYLNMAMAHELLHACNVYHHGDAGEDTVKWRRVPGTDRVVEEHRGTEREVQVLKEDGTRLNVVFPETPVEVLLGGPDGPHAGPENCVMRYDIANGYRSTNDAATRYRVTEEWSFLLCAKTEGDGVNDASRNPQSRYGHSASGRGDCAHQILVNDAVKAVAR